MEVGWTLTWRNRMAPSKISSMKMGFAYLGVNNYNGLSLFLFIL